MTEPGDSYLQFTKYALEGPKGIERYGYELYKHEYRQVKASQQSVLMRWNEESMMWEPIMSESLREEFIAQVLARLCKLLHVPEAQKLFIKYIKTGIALWRRICSSLPVYRPGEGAPDSGDGEGGPGTPPKLTSLSSLDPIKRTFDKFLEQGCVVEPTAQYKRSELQAAYLSFCQQEKFLTHLSRTQVVERIYELFPAQQKVKAFRGFGPKTA
jgi:hypothetical protein